MELKLQWMGLTVPDCFHCTEVLEGLLEALQFFLGEPITLGLFPYFTHGKHDDLNNVSPVMQDDGNTGKRTVFWKYGSDQEPDSLEIVYNGCGCR